MTSDAECCRLAKAKTENTIGFASIFVNYITSFVLDSGNGNKTNNVVF